MKVLEHLILKLDNFQLRRDILSITDNDKNSSPTEYIK